MMSKRIGIVFPGQGSQQLGMLADIAQQFNEVHHVFDEASSVLGYDLWRLTQVGPLADLDNTVHTQPALLATSYAIWRIIQARRPLQPYQLAGHSLGEYTALVCAESLTFQDAISLVAARGKYMQEAVSPGDGAMAAIIGLDEEQVTAICDSVTHTDKNMVSPANFNSIGQVVISGHKKAVNDAMVLAKEKGAKLVMPIPVSVPSHCQLMKEAADKLAVLLAKTTINFPILTVINNADVQAYTDAASIRDGLTRQLVMPVRWVETIQEFVKHHITDVIECGPGKILTGLNKRIDKQLALMSTCDMASLTSLLNLKAEDI